MVKAIILDVDGVIIGEKSPYPHPDVICKLKEIRSKGMPVSLCTARPSFTVKRIITDASLNNLHIADGGAVVLDPIDHIILEKHTIPTSDAVRIIGWLLENNIYTEVHCIEMYIIQKNRESEITTMHTGILQAEPQKVQSLVEEAKRQEIIKIVGITTDEKEKATMVQDFPFHDNTTLSWAIHPVAFPRQFAVITAKGISKKHAVLKIAESIHVDPKEILGIGDSAHDWQFIELCGYGAAMGNATEELKRKVLTKGKEYSYIGGSVDENGIIGILEHFL